MANIKLDTIRAGAELLGQVLKAADQEAFSIAADHGVDVPDDAGNKKVDGAELETFLEEHGDKGSLNAAARALHGYAAKRFGTSELTFKQINAALTTALRAFDKADKDESGWLSSKEQASLAPTFGALAVFAKDYKGASIDKILKQAPPEQLTGTKLQAAFTKAAKDATWVSESDETPTFVSVKAPMPWNKEGVMKAFQSEIKKDVEGDFDIVSLDVADFWKDVTAEPESGSYSSSNFNKGWKALKKAVDDNLFNARLYKAGPKDEEEGGIADSQGAYVYFLVGKTTDGKLAGVRFLSVET